MHKLSMFIIALCLAGQGTLLADARVGKPAPDFTVTDVNGKSHKLSDYKGKIVVLENYNLDCPYVANHYKNGAMQKLQAEAADQGVVWLVVNSSYAEPDRLKKEVDSRKIKAAAAVYDPKGAIGREYGFKTTPHMFVIDKNGVVAYNGAVDDQPDTDHSPAGARNYIREAMQKLGAGQSLEVAQTKPYGCGAKYAAR